MNVKEEGARPPDDADTDELSSLASRTSTPILQLGTKPTPENTENSSVGLEQVERHQDTGVDSNTGEKPLGAIPELPENGLGEPSKNKLVDSIESVESLDKNMDKHNSDNN